MKRRLFCELGPWAYFLSLQRQILQRKIQNIKSRKQFATMHSEQTLPVGYKYCNSYNIGYNSEKVVAEIV